MKLALPALAPPRGASPAHRRAALARLTDAALADRLLELASALRESTTPKQRKALAAAAGLPLGEVVASPFALRIVALGVAAGATTVHHELRALLPARGGPVRDAAHGRWSAGVLHAGKYQQFGAEDPLAVFHPDHGAKWGPHELCHRAIGFFHRRDASPFELYLGARLNELVPVVTWYGPEQALRLDEGEFDRERAGREKHADAAAARWLAPDPVDLHAQALVAAHLVRDGIAHLERELAAIDEELRTGRTVRVPHPFLDASSDALAYVAAHRGWLESGPCNAVLDGFARRGVERFAHVDAYRAHVEAVFDALLFEPIALDLERASRETEARFVWDLMQRTARLGKTTWKRAEPLLAEAEALASDARRGERVELAPFREALREALGSQAELVLAQGDARFEDGLCRAQLRDGLATTLPTLVERVDASALADELLASPRWLVRAPLQARVLAQLAQGHPLELRDRARFDAAIADAGRRDDRHVLSTDPERFPANLARLRIDRARGFELLRLAHDPLERTAEGHLPRKNGAILVGHGPRGLVVVPVPEAFGSTFAALADAPLDGAQLLARLVRVLRIHASNAHAFLAELVSVGALVATSVEPAPDAHARTSAEN